MLFFVLLRDVAKALTQRSRRFAKERDGICVLVVLRSLLLRQGSTTSLAGFFGSVSICEMQGFLHSCWSVEMTILW